MRRMDAFAMVGGLFTAIGGFFLVAGLCVSTSLDRILAMASVEVEGDPDDLVLMFVCMGGLFVAIGTTLLFRSIRRRRWEKWMIRYGRPVWAEVVDIQYDWSVRIDRKQALKLMLREDASDRGGREFWTGPLPQSEDVLRAAGARAKVYVDDGTGAYFVDASTLRPDRRPPAR